MAIGKVAVIGSGVMGAAIAAHAANAGADVVLLDIVPEGAEDRSVLARSAIAKMLKTRPAPFMHKRNARRITPGNLEDDLGLIADCDWICEAVIENPDIKRDLYGRLEDVRKDGSIITSNTSTMPLSVLTEGMPERFRRDFAITHFFNPPRYMRLLELVGGPDTRPEVLEELRGFCDVSLGKEVVDCRDTPGFIANRIGIYWSQVAMAKAYDLGLSVEEADAIVGKPMGIPKTGIFGLADLTGIDLGPHVIASMLKLLPETDALAQAYDPEHGLKKLMDKMIAEGYTGRKGKGGFYRMRKEGGRRIKEVLDFATGEYRPADRPQPPSVKAAGRNMRALCEFDDKGGRYAWAVLSAVLSYSASLIPEIGEDIDAIDRAMKAGYAWKWGPFEQIDMLGVDWFVSRLEKEGREVPPLLKAAAGRPLYKEEGRSRYRMTLSGDYVEIPVPEGAWMLADIKRGAERIDGNGSASLWDLGDGVACLELHSKMNSIDDKMVEMFVKAGKIDKRGFKALVIGTDADNFSVGANLGVALFAANIGLWPVLEGAIANLQNALMGLKYAPFPVVAAVGGMALGGGCEIALHADAVQAHAESYMGLVEVGVGLLPAGGGCKEMITRAVSNRKRPGGPMPPVAQVFEIISTAKVSTSAEEARDLGFLRRTDRITMNRKRLMADAKSRALELAEGYVAPEPIELFLPGPTGQAALALAVEGFVKSGRASEYDAVVSAEVARVITGGDTDITEPVSEQQLLDLERAGFMKLLHNEKTLERMEHMLTTGKPLRN